MGDALSMGLGDFISSKSELEFSLSERKREAWECEIYFEGEKSEMLKIYENRGFSTEDATELIDIFSKYSNNFIDNMMIEELGIIPPNEDESIAKPALFTFLSFIVFGIIPLIPFIIAAGLKDFINGPNNVYFIVCIVMTVLTLFGLGAWTSKFSSTRWFISGLEMAILGSVAAAVSYGVGSLGAYIIGSVSSSLTSPTSPTSPMSPFIPQVTQSPSLNPL